VIGPRTSSARSQNRRLTILTFCRRRTRQGRLLLHEVHFTAKLPCSVPTMRTVGYPFLMGLRQYGFRETAEGEICCKWISPQCPGAGKRAVALRPGWDGLYKTHPRRHLNVCADIFGSFHSTHWHPYALTCYSSLFTLSSLTLHGSDRLNNKEVSKM
jgi:hypothetical protein